MLSFGQCSAVKYKTGAGVYTKGKVWVSKQACELELIKELTSSRFASLERELIP